MFNLIMFVIITVVIYVFVKLFLNLKFPEYSKNFIVVGVPTLVLGVILTCFQPYKVEKVDSGNVGVKVNLIGDDRGVSKYEYKSGWVFYNTYTEALFEFPIYQQIIKYDVQEVITKGGFTAKIHPSFAYVLKSGSIGDMFINLRLPLREIEQGWLQITIVGAINDVANKWEVDRIFNEREKFEAAIVAECNKRIGKWFRVSGLRTNIIPPHSLQKAIEAKTNAIQQALAEDQKALTAEAEARKNIAIAKGDSAVTVINAQAVAKVMKIKQKELSPIYIEYLKWVDVNPNVPRVPQVVSSSAVLKTL